MEGWDLGMRLGGPVVQSHLLLLETLDHDELLEAGEPLIPMSSNGRGFPFLGGGLRRRGGGVRVTIPVRRVGMHLGEEGKSL